MVTRITTKLDKLVKTVDNTSDSVVGRLAKLKDQTSEMTLALEQVQTQMDNLEEKLEEQDGRKRRKSKDAGDVSD